jgi:hypothetical protein
LQHDGLEPQFPRNSEKFDVTAAADGGDGDDAGRGPPWRRTSDVIPGRRRQEDPGIKEWTLTSWSQGDRRWSTGTKPVLEHVSGDAEAKALLESAGATVQVK